MRSELHVNRVKGVVYDENIPRPHPFWGYLYYTICLFMNHCRGGRSKCSSQGVYNICNQKRVIKGR